MKSKYFFEEFKKEAEEEHKVFDTHVESKELSKERCNHKGKVRYENGMLKCSCGSAWSGPGLDTLFELLNKSV